MWRNLKRIGLVLLLCGGPVFALWLVTPLVQRHQSVQLSTLTITGVKHPPVSDRLEGFLEDSPSVGIFGSADPAQIDEARRAADLLVARFGRRIPDDRRWSRRLFRVAVDHRLAVIERRSHLAASRWKMSEREFARRWAAREVTKTLRGGDKDLDGWRDDAIPLEARDGCGAIPVWWMTHEDRLECAMRLGRLEPSRPDVARLARIEPGAALIVLGRCGEGSTGTAPRWITRQSARPCDALRPRSSRSA